MPDPRGGFGHEGQTRPRGDSESEQDTNRLDAYFRTLERLNDQAEFFSRLAANRYRVMAVFGLDAAANYDDIYAIRREVTVSVMMLIQTDGQRNEGSLPEDRMAWEKVIGWRTIDGDAIADRLAAAVVAMEKVCRPVIQKAME